MDTRPRSVQVVRWLSGGTFLIAALYFLNLAAFHTWAAGGPPTSNPEWHAMWATRFSWSAFGFLMAAFGVVWLLRKRKPAGSKSN
jgi:hypothetical protein